MSDLSHHVRQFVPACAEGEEMELRKALLTARDYAAAQRCKVTADRALNLACDAHEAAGAFAFANVPVPVLKLAVGYCRNMVHAAYLAEHLESEVAR